MVTRTNQGQVSRLGLLLSTAAAIWLLLAPALGHMGRPWPCFVAGAIVLTSLLMAWRRPQQRRGWSLLVIVISTTILLVGSSAVLPAVLGIVGGALMIAWSRES